MSDRQVRVLVANEPRLMRELVLAVIDDQPDIDVIGEICDSRELADAVEEARPDVLITALDSSAAQRCETLIRRYPQMRIIALAPEQNAGFVYWGAMEFRSKPVESSQAGLLGALRERSSMSAQP
jgi:chemotaxis response regulator CheB